MSEIWLFTLLTLMSYRLQRFITMDTVPGEWIRDGFDEESKLREMVSCSWCLGSWTTFAVFAVAAQFTSITWPAVQALAAAGLVGLLGSLDRALP